MDVKASRAPNFFIKSTRPPSLIPGSKSTKSDGKGKGKGGDKGTKSDGKGRGKGGGKGDGKGKGGSQVRR